LRAAFDAWVDVQRRWVYLEGILFGSSDIQAQLPAEWSRFKSVDAEFVTLMRRIASKPFAVEALNVDNLQHTLKRLGNFMGFIQKALGDYLENECRTRRGKVFGLLFGRFSMDGYICDPEHRVQESTTRASSTVGGYGSGNGEWVNPPRLQDPDRAFSRQRKDTVEQNFGC
jgi:hypothetical protein